MKKISYYPRIRVTTRQLTDYNDSEGLFQLEKKGAFSTPPKGYYQRFDSFRDMFRKEFYQLSHDLDESRDYSVYLIRLNVEFEDGAFPAGYRWEFVGRLVNGEHFFAVIFASVQKPFRGCGVSSLLKIEEVNLAKRLGCDYIQSVVEAKNPHFKAVIVPNLANGFAFYHGSNNGGEVYEEEGIIHLRKYLGTGDAIDVRVRFTDGHVFLSPSENPEIIEHLSKIPDWPGYQIAEVETYPDVSFQKTETLANP